MLPKIVFIVDKFVPNLISCNNKLRSILKKRCFNHQHQPFIAVKLGNFVESTFFISNLCSGVNWKTKRNKVDLYWILV
jgi:hypothetical protein